MNPGHARTPTSCEARGKLSRRTLEVLRALATGATYEQAGARLCVSPHTVHGHVWRACRTLGVSGLQAALLKVGIVRIVEDEL